MATLVFWRKPKLEQHWLPAHLRDGWSEEIVEAFFGSARRPATVPWSSAKPLQIDLDVSVDGYAQDINNEMVERRAYGWAMLGYPNLPIPALVYVGPDHDEQYKRPEGDVGLATLDGYGWKDGEKRFPVFEFRLTLPAESTSALRETLQMCATTNTQPSLSFRLQPEEARAELKESGSAAMPITRFWCHALPPHARLSKHPLYRRKDFL